MAMDLQAAGASPAGHRRAVRKRLAACRGLQPRKASSFRRSDGAARSRDPSSLQTLYGSSDISSLQPLHYLHL